MPDRRPESLQYRQEGIINHPDQSSNGQNHRRQKPTNDTIKRAEFNFMLDLKTLIVKSATGAELNRVRDAMRRGEKNTAPEQYRPIFEKLSNKWGLTINEKINLPTELRK